MQTPYKSVKKALSFVLDLIFVKKCLGCRKNNEIICQNCLDHIWHNEDIRENYIFAPYAYQDTLIKKVIWQLKYYNRKDLCDFFGKILYENYIEEINDMRLYNLGQSVQVIPVPLSKNRFKKRGYNQAEILAKSFCTQSNKNVLEGRFDILEKSKETIPQAQIKNKNERLLNAKNVYKVLKPQVVKNRNIIIIDDVYTTGGTINEIKKILEKAGARKVIGITIAH